MGAPRPLDLCDLKAISVLGRGAKGTVFLVVTNDGQTLALKVMSKPSMIESRYDPTLNNSYRRMGIEKDVLSILDYPLLPSLQGFISTPFIIGFAMDRCSGGNLSTLRKKQPEKKFSENTIRFYAAELVLVLEHLHNLGIVYRDLKPENIMIQDSGHLMLIDFDLTSKLTPMNVCVLRKSNRSTNRHRRHHHRHHPSKLKSFFSCNSLSKFLSDSSEDKESESSRTASCHSASSTTMAISQKSHSHSFVGTEEYVSPEVIRGTGHDFAVDWWSLGVVLHELAYGKTPFYGQNRRETFSNIVSKPVETVGEKNALRDLIGKLLDKDKNKRIRVDAIKSHEFFRNLDWDSVLEISRPPFIPIEEQIKVQTEEESIDMEKFVKNAAYAKFNLDAKKKPKNTVVEDKYTQHVGFAVIDNNVNVLSCEGDSFTDEEDEGSSLVSEFLIF